MTRPRDTPWKIAEPGLVEAHNDTEACLSISLIITTSLHTVWGETSFNLCAAYFWR